MHRFVWLCEKGEIPKGYDIHHIDHDKGNNDISNLELVTRGVHNKLHWEELPDDEKQKRIANINNNSRPKAVEWHKSEKGAKLHKELGDRMRGVKKPKNTECTCFLCGKKFMAVKSSAKWCSGVCASQFRRDNHLDDVERVCCICGKTFMVNKYSNATTCSRKCAYASRNKGN